MASSVQVGDSFPVEVNLWDGEAMLTGKTVSLSIRRNSDDKYWDGDSFETGFDTVSMVEQDASDLEGLYVYNFTPAAAGVYSLRVDYVEGAFITYFTEQLLAQPELATAAAVADLNNVSTAEVNAQCDTAISDAFTFASGDVKATLDGETVALSDNAITAAKYDESTAYPLKSVDTGASQVARVGADGDTLEDLSDEIAALNNVSTAEVNAQCDTAISDAFAFAGTDVKATLDGEEVVTDSASRTASKADVSALATTVALSAHDGKLDTVDGIVDDLKAATILVDTTIASAGRSETTARLTAGSDQDDAYNGMWAILDSDEGNGLYVSRFITDYDGGNKEVTFTPGLIHDADDGGQIYIVPGPVYLHELVAAILADTNELQTDDIPAAIAALHNVSAAEVEAACEDALADYDAPTNTDLDTGLAALPSDADIQGFLRTALGTNGSDVIAETAQGVPTATPTMAEAVMLRYMALRNQCQATNSELAIYNDAGTKITKGTLSDDGTTFQKTKLASGA